MASGWWPRHAVFRGGLMNPTAALGSTEEVYRIVKRSQRFYVDEINHQVNTAFFKKEPGASVDRQGDRTREAAQEALQQQFQNRLKGIAMVYGDDIEKANVVAIPAPSPADIYHMELYGDQNQHPINLKQAYALAKAAHIIKWRDDVAWNQS